MVVYRKFKEKNKILLYVPQAMTNKVIFHCHDCLGHVVVDTIYEYLSRVYWFPNFREKVKRYIQNCLCIMYSFKVGKSEASLHITFRRVIVPLRQYILIIMAP